MGTTLTSPRLLAPITILGMKLIHNESTRLHVISLTFINILPFTPFSFFFFLFFFFFLIFLIFLFLFLFLRWDWDLDFSPLGQASPPRIYCTPNSEIIPPKATSQVNHYAGPKILPTWVDPSPTTIFLALPILGFFFFFLILIWIFYIHLKINK